jgi:ectoine hydroxylase-related dioxygenase (phytanoyl-CoA dioxygenase family)
MVDEVRQVEDGSVRTSYAHDGFLVVPDLLERAAVGDVVAEATAVCRGDRGDIDGLQPVADGEDDDRVLARHLCIHFPHKLSTVLADISRHPGIVEVLTQIIGPNVKMMQSMLFIKGPGKPGQAWHQDEGHIPTRDRSLTGVWIALDDASVDNGCMWVIPGSHRPGVLYPVRHHHDRRFDPTPEAHGFDHEDHAVPVEVPAGGVVFFNGYLLHRSLPNERPGGHRRALVNHYMSCESLLPWLPPGSDEAMATLDMRDIVLVAGHDPHASKGVVDIMRPRLRADSAVDESAPPGT